VVADLMMGKMLGGFRRSGPGYARPSAHRCRTAARFRAHVQHSMIALPLALFLAWPALAQMPDYCAAPLAAKDDPATALDWRLRCTIQKLQAERVQQADRATQDEVEIARLAALLRSAQAQKPSVEPIGRHSAPIDAPTVIKGRK
jgi:hypothetical protein